MPDTSDVDEDSFEEESSMEFDRPDDEFVVFEALEGEVGIFEDYVFSIDVVVGVFGEEEGEVFSEGANGVTDVGIVIWGFFSRGCFRWFVV